jgi:hypothetical protein
MPKKKARKKSAKSKTATAKKTTSAKKPLKKQTRKAAPKKKVAAKKKAAAKKKPAAKTKALSNTKSPVRKKVVRKTTAAKRRQVRVEDQILESSPYARPKSAALSGDLQGLSNVEGADSESVDELLDEGNAFEAGVVAGVERARNNEGKEVRTHEVPEDDVPEEYLDKD